jgi:hypothetical protein
MDLSELRGLDGSVQVLFSNAFFEHLYRDKRVLHLRSAYRALGPGGTICYLGLPNFPVVARAYLEGLPGTVGSVFDLHHAYRYTHGDPESVGGWYLEQLHKSLFDRAEIGSLLGVSGFDSFVVFQYAYPTDFYPLTVNLGFYARKPPLPESLQRDCLTFLEGYLDRVDLSTLEFID